MKVLHVYHIYPALFGGASTVVYQITKELHKRGHVADVLTTDAYFTGEENQEESINVYRFALVSQTLSKKNLIIPNLKFILWAKRMVKNYDCIHIHGYRNLYTPFIYHYAKKYKVPYVLQAHGTLPNIIAKQKLKSVYDVLFGYKLLRDASKVIALSKVETEQYKTLGVPEDKIAIVPNGIDLSEYANLPRKGTLKKKFGISENKKVILYLGRIHRVKGIDFLVKAYAYLTKNSGRKDTILVIAGPDDGYLSEVNFMIQSLGISNSVLFTGPVYGKNKIQAYIDSDVFVLPSRYDAFPMTVLEAYACSRPVIASKVEGLKDLVKHEETGFLFEPGNSEQLARTILYLLNDNCKAEEMGLKGALFMKENFSIEKLVDKVLSLYSVLLESYLHHDKAHRKRNKGFYG